MVHKKSKARTRIVLHDILNGLGKCLRTAPQQKAHYRVPKGVVHDAVQLPPQKVPPAHAIGRLVGRILPDLPQHHGLRVLLLRGLREPVYEQVRQLVGHVQPPARGPGPKPPAHNAVLAVYELVIALLGLVDVGKGVKAPPAVILPGPVPEIIPFIVWRLLGVIGPRALIPALPVKVHAVAAGMAEHPVYHHVYAQLPGAFAQVPKVLLVPQQRVYLQVIRRVVPVVRVALEHRVQVDAGDPQLL